MEPAPAIEQPVASPPESRSGRRRLRWWILGAGLAVLAVALILQSVPSGGPSGVSADQRAPDFRLNRLDDPSRVVSLADYRGGPLVLNFWASWCVPCRKEMPAFESVAGELKGRVEFLGVNEQDTRPGALDLVAKTGVRYPSVVDPGGTLMTAYGFRGLPNTAFISADGALLDVHLGEINAVDLRAAIQRLFKI